MRHCLTFETQFDAFSRQHFSIKNSGLFFTRLPIRNIFLKKSQFVKFLTKALKTQSEIIQNWDFHSGNYCFVCFLIRQCVIIISIWKSPWPRGGGTPSEGCSCLPRVAPKKGENDLEKILSPESKIGSRYAILWPISRLEKIFKIGNNVCEEF